jgi:hypothetical protein
MTVLLMLAFLTIFLTIDWYREKKREHAAFAAPVVHDVFPYSFSSAVGLTMADGGTPALPPITPGDVVVVNYFGGSFFSSSIRFFSKGWSHTAVAFFDSVRPAPQLFEADVAVMTTEWRNKIDNPDYDVRVYHWVKQPANMEEILWTIYDKYNGNTYGFFQIPWFMWRWIVTGLHLPARWARKNFFPNNEICTEVIYVMFKLLQDKDVDAALLKNNRDQNTVWPADITFICDELVKAGRMVMSFNRERKL